MASQAAPQRADPNANLHNNGGDDGLSKRREQVLRVPAVGGYHNSPRYNGHATKDYGSASAQNPSGAKWSILKSMFVQKVEDGLTRCNCQDTIWRPGVILDPFCGRGTTCIVARKLGRDFVVIDLNPDFCKLARDHLAPLMAQETLTGIMK